MGEKTALNQFSPVQKLHARRVVQGEEPMVDVARLDDSRGAPAPIKLTVAGEVC